MSKELLTQLKDNVQLLIYYHDSIQEVMQELLRIETKLGTLLETTYLLTKEGDAFAVQALEKYEKKSDSYFSTAQSILSTCRHEHSLTEKQKNFLCNFIIKTLKISKEEKNGLFTCVEKEINFKPKKETTK
jgi:hypothetical protein